MSNGRALCRVLVIEADPLSRGHRCTRIDSIHGAIIIARMAKKGPPPKRASKGYAQDVKAMETALSDALRPPAGRPSSLLDTRVIYCGDCLEQLRKLPDRCIDLIYIDPPFNSNRNYEVFWGETKERRAFEDWMAGTADVRLASPVAKR